MYYMSPFTVSLLMIKILALKTMQYFYITENVIIFVFVIVTAQGN